MVICFLFLRQDQYTPLHLTCFSGFKDVAEILLQHGALTGAVNKVSNFSSDSLYGEEAKAANVAEIIEI